MSGFKISLFLDIDGKFFFLTFVVRLFSSNVLFSVTYHYFGKLCTSEFLITCPSLQTGAWLVRAGPTPQRPG